MVDSSKNEEPSFLAKLFSPILNLFRRPSRDNLPKVDLNNLIKIGIIKNNKQESRLKVFYDYSTYYHRNNGLKYHVKELAQMDLDTQKRVLAGHTQENLLYIAKEIKKEGDIIISEVNSDDKTQQKINKNTLNNLSLLTKSMINAKNEKMHEDKRQFHEDMKAIKNIMKDNESRNKSPKHHEKKPKNQGESKGQQDKRASDSQIKKSTKQPKALEWRSHASKEPAKKANVENLEEKANQTQIQDNSGPKLGGSR